MSEFTSGHLLLSSHKEAIRQHAAPRSLLKVLDEKWVAYLTPNDAYPGYLVPDHILQLSQDTPVMHFCSSGDHFWFYRIFHKGEELAYLTISYEFKEELIIDYFEEHYPDKEILDLYSDGLHDEISRKMQEQGLFEKAVDHLFDECNVEAFRLFNISDKQIDRLRAILNPTYYRNHPRIYGLVEEFKEILDIEQMSGTRHERVEEDGEFEEQF